MEIIRESEWKSETYYTLNFDIDSTCGLRFPCDKNGKVEDLNPSAEANYRYCLEHPEEYREPYVDEEVHSWLEPAVGKCLCGAEVPLRYQFHGACQCPNCGRWYSVFGEDLIDPMYWEEDFSDYEYEPW